MKFTEAQNTLGHFVLLFSILMIILIMVLLHKAQQQTRTSQQQSSKSVILFGGVMMLWMIYLWFGGKHNWFAKFDRFPPSILPLAVLPPLALVIYLTFSGKLDALLRRFNAGSLIGIQVFRIGVELILWQSCQNGFTPEQMTFDGLNYDIISGVAALPVMWWINKNPGTPHKTLTIAYNLIGLALLINIVTIAVLSFPGPTRYFSNEPSNLLVSQYPFIYIPTIFVPIAYTFHLFSLRKLTLTLRKHE